LLYQAEDVDGKLQLGAEGCNVSMLGVLLHLMFNPGFDPVPIASILVSWRLHRL
jgi:hypothetical protein